MIRPVEKKDAPSICGIYNYYVNNTVVTFEEASVDMSEMERRIRNITETHPWYVLEEEGQVLAYAYASPWRVKSAYRFSTELTVYVDRNSHGRGFGSTLYAYLIEEMEKRGMHCLYGVIALPNEPSSRLHEKFGFKKCGHFNQVGYKMERWIDVGYWEKVRANV
ncbi:MAG: N-acetyltransferase [Spirochaetaceae bacterium]|nr:N-acetyltransferase [Spirochaetaceae bacterium]